MDQKGKKEGIGGGQNDNGKKNEGKEEEKDSTASVPTGLLTLISMRPAATDASPNTPTKPNTDPPSQLPAAPMKETTGTNEKQIKIFLKSPVLRRPKELIVSENVDYLTFRRMVATMFPRRGLVLYYQNKELKEDPINLQDGASVTVLTKLKSGVIGGLMSDTFSEEESDSPLAKPISIFFNFAPNKNNNNNVGTNSSSTGTSSGRKSPKANALLDTSEDENNLVNEGNPDDAIAAELKKEKEQKEKMKAAIDTLRERRRKTSQNALFKPPANRSYSSPCTPHGLGEAINHEQATQTEDASEDISSQQDTDPFSPAIHWPNKSVSYDDVRLSQKVNLDNAQELDKVFRTLKSKMHRCGKCRVGVNALSRYKCHCNRYFCVKHYMPENHSCAFDYKQDGQEFIQRLNPKFPARKGPDQ